MKCLSTKLQSTANNSALRKFNELKLEFLLDSVATGTFEIKTANNVTFAFRSTDNTYLYKGNGVDFLGDIENCQAAEFPSTSFMTFKPKGKGYVFFKPCNQIDNIIIGGSSNNNTKIFAESLVALSDNIKVINFQSSMIEGDMSNVLSKFTKLTDLNLSLATFRAFDIVNLGNCKSLITLLVAVPKGEKAFGSIESLVKAQLSAGRTSGSISLADYNSDITLNGVKNSVNARRTITFNSATNVTITFNSATVATYDNGTWTYS